MSITDQQQQPASPRQPRYRLNNQLAQQFHQYSSASSFASSASAATFTPMSSIDRILHRTRFKLEDLLDLDEQLIQEAKFGLNEKLVEFLTKRETVEQLVRYTIAEPPKPAVATSTIAAADDASVKSSSLADWESFLPSLTAEIDDAPSSSQQQPADIRFYSPAVTSVATGSPPSPLLDSFELGGGRKDTAEGEEEAAESEEEDDDDEEEEEDEDADSEACTSDEDYQPAYRNQIRFPYIASELLSLEANPMVDVIMNDADEGSESFVLVTSSSSHTHTSLLTPPSLLTLLFSVLLRPAPLDPSLICYFRKVLQVLIQRSYKRLVKWCDRNHVLDALLQHIGLYSVLEMIIMLGGWDNWTQNGGALNDPDSEGGEFDLSSLLAPEFDTPCTATSSQQPQQQQQQQSQSHWLIRHNLIPKLIRLLHPRYSTLPDIHPHASRLLVDIVVKASLAQSNELVKEMHESVLMQAMVDGMFPDTKQYHTASDSTSSSSSAAAHLSSLSHSLSVFIVLVQRAANCRASNLSISSSGKEEDEEEGNTTQATAEDTRHRLLYGIATGSGDDDIVLGLNEIRKKYEDFINARKEEEEEKRRKPLSKKKNSKSIEKKKSSSSISMNESISTTEAQHETDVIPAEASPSPSSSSLTSYFSSLSLPLQLPSHSHDNHIDFGFELTSEQRHEATELGEPFLSLLKVLPRIFRLLEEEEAVENGCQVTAVESTNSTIGDSELMSRSVSLGSAISFSSTLSTTNSYYDSDVLPERSTTSSTTSSAASSVTSSAASSAAASRVASLSNLHASNEKGKNGYGNGAGSVAAGHSASSSTSSSTSSSSTSSTSPLPIPGVLSSPAFGQLRLKILELCLVLSRMHSPLIDYYLMQCRVPEILLGLFIRFPWNNFMHCLVESFFMTVFEDFAVVGATTSTGTSAESTTTASTTPTPTPTPFLLHSLFRDGLLIECLITTWQHNQDIQIRGGLRRGYMGHLIRLATSLNTALDQLPSAQQVNSLLSLSKERYIWFIREVLLIELKRQTQELCKSVENGLDLSNSSDESQNTHETDDIASEQQQQPSRPPPSLEKIQMLVLYQTFEEEGNAPYHHTRASAILNENSKGVSSYASGLYENDDGGLMEEEDGEYTQEYHNEDIANENSTETAVEQAVESDTADVAKTDTSSPDIDVSKKEEAIPSSGSPGTISYRLSDYSKPITTIAPSSDDRTLQSELEVL